MPTTKTEKEFRKTIPFIIASKNKIKYLGINVTKEVKELYDELKKTSEGGKILHAHGLAELT
jgi:hypothetical protein